MHGFWLYFLNTAFPVLWFVFLVSTIASWAFSERPTVFAGTWRSIIITAVFLLLVMFGIPTMITINTPG